MHGTRAGRPGSTYALLVVLAVAAVMVPAVPATADHVPPPGGPVAGTGTLEGTELSESQVFLGQPCFAATSHVYGLQGAGTFHGRTAGGQVVVYRAQLEDGQAVHEGPLQFRINNTEPFHHGPNGTHGADSSCSEATAGTPVPATFSVFAADHVYKLDGTGTQVACVGQGSFAREGAQGQNWHADWALSEDCVVVGNAAGTPGQGAAAAATEFTHFGSHGPCFGGECVDNFKVDYAQYLPVQGLALYLSGPTSATTGNPVNITARLTEDGNPVPSVAVTFAVAGPAPATPPGGAALTGADGRAVFTFTAPAEGDYTVTGSATNAGEVRSGTHTVRFVPPEPPGMSLAGPTSSQTEEEVTVNATVTDAGDPVAGAVVDFAVAGPGQATPAAGLAVTGADGRASFSFSADRAGGYTATASATHLGQELSAAHSVHLAINTLHREASLTMPDGEDSFDAAVIDPAGDYAYFATGIGVNPGRVIKVDLNTFQRVGAITLNSGEASVTSAVIDPAGDYAYFGTGLGSPGRVIKVDLNTFQRVGTITLPTGEARLRSAVIDPAGAYAYFGTDTEPGRVVKVDLATFERVGAVTFETGENRLQSAVIDPAGDFAYFGTVVLGADPVGKVVRVDLASFERAGAVVLQGSAEAMLTSAVVDPAGDYAYFGTDTLPARVVKVSLNPFQRVGAITLNARENGFASAVIDPAGAYAYFGTDSGEVLARVIKIDLGAFERVHAISLAAGDEDLLSAVIHPDGTHAYFGTGFNAPPGSVPVPTKVIKIAVSRPPNPALAAANDAYATDYATPVVQPAPGVLANDVDTGDGDPLTAGQASDPAGGIVTLNPDGSFTYTPDVGFSGTDTFTYTASDAMDYSAPATVSVVVAAPPDGVSAVSGAAFGYATSVSLFGGPAEPRGPAPSVTLAPSGGDQTATDPDGDSAQYGPARIFENHGALTVATQGATGPGGSATSSASVKNLEDNDPFHAHSPDGEASSACTANETGLSGSARIVNGRLVTSTHPTTGVTTSEVVFPHIYDPAPNTTYDGSLDHIGDNWRIVFNEQILSPDAIVVNAVHLYLLGPTAVGDMIIGSSRCGVAAAAPNAAPVAADDAYTVTAGRPLVVAASGVLANDTDADGQPLSAATLVGTPPPTSGGGAWTFPSDPANGTLALGADGSFTYTPDAGFVGTDTFTYLAHDVRGKADQATVTVTVGAALRKAVADFDGDNDTDRSVFRNGAWYAEGQPTVFFGVAGDIAVPGDYDGDGDADHAVYRQGAWLTEGQAPAYLGLATDVPVPGDYDGDGTTDRAVFRPSVGAWYIEGQATIYQGAEGDIPVPGDYDGDGDAEVGIWRPAVGGWYIAGAATEFLGLAGDIPVPGDYDGNGTTDRGIWRPAVGGWYIAGAATQFVGLAGDVPVAGDYDGDGDTDRGIWRPEVGGWYVDGQAPAYLGAAGDVPLPLPAAIHGAFF